MTNIYSFIHYRPEFQFKIMYLELEQLAVTIVESGKLRIDAYDKINYARLYLPYQKISLTFSKRQLTNRVADTKSLLKKLATQFPEINLNIELEIKKLIDQLNKFNSVEAELELKLARLFVQAAHPVIIKFLIFEQVEIFISYSGNIGDVLDIKSWQDLGQNSGMQSSDHQRATIFISTGGDPFLPTKQDALYGDGWPALARFMIIAAQEIGHYSDIIRNKKGYYVDRHSANIGAYASKPGVSKARLSDLAQLALINNSLNNLNLIKLHTYEQNLKFYNKYRKFSLTNLILKLKILILVCIFKYRALKIYPLLRETFIQEKYPISKLVIMLKDMEFNLAPKAQVYERQDPNEQDAIACIEALARVPQQVIKWGHSSTKLIMKNLYEIYYKQLINRNIGDYSKLSKEDYQFKSKKFNKLILLIRKIIKPKIKIYYQWHY